MKKIFILAFYTGLALGVLSCREDERLPITSGTTPRSVSQFSVVNLAGGAEISYEIPDENVAYVLAEYYLKGSKQQVRSSKYRDHVVVEGFPEAGSYEVSLFAVGRNEQRSEPTVVEISPLTPPVQEAFNTLNLIADFGGANVAGENALESDLVLEVITPGATGEWEVAEQFFTSSKNINFSARGFDTDKRKFGVYVRDRWLNYSDTLFAEFSPYFEEQVDMSNFYETNLPGDASQMHQTGAARRMSWLFDGRTGNQQYGYYSLLNTGVPQHFTIFLQGEYQLSRIKLWQHIDSKLTYGSANPRRFRVWGSMDPNPDGSFDDSWYLLGEFENIKPSGLPVGETSAEDIATATAGEEYTFSLDVPTARYIRVETLETWGRTQHVYITEMGIWGGKVN